MDLSEVEIQQLKEQNNRRVKRVVSVVALTLIIASIILVALSLSLGPKIDDLGTLIKKANIFDSNPIIFKNILKISKQKFRRFSPTRVHYSQVRAKKVF